MKHFLLEYLKYIVLALAVTVLLTATGVDFIGKIETNENKKSSYTRTEFDYTINCPSAEQVDELLAGGAVEDIFPCYVDTRAFGRSNSEKTMYLFLSDRMESMGISLFGEQTLVKGNFEKDGIYVDANAAKALGVKVGDDLTITLSGKSVTRKVTALCLPSTFGVYTYGIALTELTPDLKEVYSPRTYSTAFIKSSNKAALKQQLSDYAGEGNVPMGFEEYVNSVCGAATPPIYTDEEWHDECVKRYEAFCKEILDPVKRTGYDVTEKAAQFVDKEKAEKADINIRLNRMMLAAIGFLVFTSVCTLFIVINKKSDGLKRDGGMSRGRMVGRYVAICSATAAVAFVLTFAALIITAASTYFTDICLPTVLWHSLSIPVAGVAADLIAVLYVWALYSNKNKKGRPAEVVPADGGQTGPANDDWDGDKS